ncbi:hypothetical protein [uncultured Methylobacterium sp.]|jgi:hypothetical protein|uniref:hypothetical protein n=1 Tax=uncultured Methylobacterium sp. TaxID=157278 RepID=UPI002635CC7A|nr:hypothetical protein [uncultured Methylobacterium sp.]
MTLRTCLLAGLAAGLLGLGLRLAVPVPPVDDAFRSVVAYYRSIDPGRAQH